MIKRLIKLLRASDEKGLSERETRLRRAVCQSFVRAMRRHGMSGRAEIQSFGRLDGPPMLFVTVERAAVRVSQEAMSVLAREMLGHAKNKYDTEIGGVYWRIDIGCDHLDGTDEYGPSTMGYLVEESAILDSYPSDIGRLLREAEQKLCASEDVLKQCAQVDSVEDYSRQLLGKINSRRHERELQVSGQVVVAANREG